MSNNNISKKYLADLMLLFTAVIWGAGFFCQKVGAETTSPFCFNCCRYIAAAVFVFFAAKCRLPFGDPKLRRHALLTGFVIYLAGTLQQIGLKTVSIGNASFITGGYIVIVPFLAKILLNRSIHPRHWLAAVIVLIGLYFLSTDGKGFSRITAGDVIVFVGSVFWALHIICMQQGVKDCDPVVFTAGQFLVAAVLYLLTWLIADGADTTGLEVSWPYAILSGAFVIGLGIILQAVGQKSAGETEASIILGLESVFGTLFGVFLYHETFSGLQILGMVLIFTAVIIAITAGQAAEGSAQH